MSFKVEKIEKAEYDQLTTGQPAPEANPAPQSGNPTPTPTATPEPTPAATPNQPADEGQPVTNPQQPNGTQPGNNPVGGELSTQEGETGNATSASGTPASSPSEPPVGEQPGNSNDAQGNGTSTTQTPTPPALTQEQAQQQLNQYMTDQISQATGGRIKSLEELQNFNPTPEFKSDRHRDLYALINSVDEDQIDQTLQRYAHVNRLDATQLDNKELLVQGALLDPEFAGLSEADIRGYIGEEYENLTEDESFTAKTELTRRINRAKQLLSSEKDKYSGIIEKGREGFTSQANPEPSEQERQYEQERQQQMQMGKQFMQNYQGIQMEIEGGTQEGGDGWKENFNYNIDPNKPDIREFVQHFTESPGIAFRDFLINYAANDEGTALSPERLAEFATVAAVGVRNFAQTAFKRGRDAGIESERLVRTNTQGAAQTIMNGANNTANPSTPTTWKGIQKSIVEQAQAQRA